VLIRTNVGDLPITGVNVVARRISRGQYPPSPGVPAFPGFPGTQIQLDAYGVPLDPPDQAATDPLASASSAVTGLDFGEGRYRIDGLPPGDYLVEIQQINPRAVGGSSIGPLDTQIPIPVPEYYNGPRESAESTDLPNDFEPVTVGAGTLTSGVGIILNGFSSTGATRIDEQEPNDKNKKAQRIDLPADISGAAAFDDASVLKMIFPDQDPDKIEDLYRFTIDSVKTIFIVLQPVNGGPSSDLDLYLFDSTLAKKKVTFGSPTVQAFSAGPTANEVIATTIGPGTYYIGVSAFDGTSTAYRLSALTSQ